MILIFIVLSISLFAQIPEWEWAISAGGGSSDKGTAIATDVDGNSYVTGHFSGSATFGSITITSSTDTSREIFVAKIDVNGNWLWVAQAGNVGNYSYDFALGIAVDNDGNSYVTGFFWPAISFGAYDLTSYGSNDIFVAKIDVDGNWLWATNAGGINGDGSFGIAIDEGGNSYITGSFLDTATFGSYVMTCSGIGEFDSDIFVAKVDMNGNWLWAIQAGGYSDNGGTAIATDVDGNSYVTGHFSGPTIFGNFTLNSSGVFVAKIDLNGNWLWVSEAQASVSGIAIDDNGNSYITGDFDLTATFGPITLTNSSWDDNIYVAKMGANGNWLWATNTDGSGDAFALGIALNSAGHSYVTGNFHGTKTFGSQTITSYDYCTDIFVSKVDISGNWQWVVQAGADYQDHGVAITIDSNENCYVTGYFRVTAIFGYYAIQSNGFDDIFVTKLGIDTSVENEVISTCIKLLNHPNPFNPTTTIEFSIQNDSHIELSVYNIKGQIIKTLARSEFIEGSHSIIWNGVDESNKQVSSGIYYYKLKVNGKIEVVKKCLLLK